jgi:hypothetical protein
VFIQLLPGAEFLVRSESGNDAFRLVVLPHDATGWGNLCEFITTARQVGDRIEKGSYRVALGETDFSVLSHCEVLLSPLPDAIDSDALCAHAQWATWHVLAAAPGWPWSCCRAWTTPCGWHSCAKSRAAPASPGGRRQCADALAFAQAAARRADGHQAGLHGP